MAEIKISNIQPCSLMVWDWKSSPVFCQRQWNYTKLS